jgi:pimeloyl-ACP methyl ester carboxylesterase
VLCQIYLSLESLLMITSRIIHVFKQHNMYQISVSSFLFSSYHLFLALTSLLTNTKMLSSEPDPNIPSIPPDPAKLTLTPNESLTFTLPDHRTIGYATYGSNHPSSPVIFLFHGMPGSRICGRSWNALCTRLNTRLIALDRPGIGLSSFSNRSMVDWPSDVLALADSLAISRFSVLGASGGAGFALACARFIPPERLRGTMVVCGIAPLDAFLDTTPYLSWRLFGVTKWILGIVARHVILPSLLRPYVGKDAAQLKHYIESQCSAPEEIALLSDTTSETNVDDAVTQFREAFKQGEMGCTHDGELLTRDWGFDLADVDSKVSMVHGNQDTIAPLATARWMDGKLGGGRLRVVQGGTHFTIWKECEEEIFRELAEM